LVVENGIVDKVHIIGVGEGGHPLGVADCRELMGQEVDECRGGGPPSDNFLGKEGSDDGWFEIGGMTRACKYSAGRTLEGCFQL